MQYKPLQIAPNLCKSILASLGLIVFLSIFGNPAWAQVPKVPDQPEVTREEFMRWGTDLQIRGAVMERLTAEEAEVLSRVVSYLRNATKLMKFTRKRKEAIDQAVAEGNRDRALTLARRVDQRVAHWTAALRSTSVGERS